ncbi:MAG TPA: hypothetical protein VFQ26_03395, partial [Nitrospiraceae bacterium]|nr:hypothetical protein [Nitrospiraceae bacterium]
MAHALLGYLETQKGYGYFYFDVSPYVYGCLMLFWGVVLYGTAFYDQLAARNQSSITQQHRVLFTNLAKTSIIAAATLLALALRGNGIQLLYSIDKVEFLAHGGRAYSLFQLVVTHAVICAYLSKRAYLIAAAAILLAVDIYIGFRSVVVLSCVSLFVVTSAENLTVEPLYRRWRTCLAGLGLLFFTIVIKYIYKGIKSQDLAYIMDMLTRVRESPLDALLSMEIEATFMMFLA